MKRKILEAFKFAKEIHANQARKDGTPYINHPIRVAENILSILNLMT